MSLSFWDTVRGVRLADTLIEELPKLTAKRKQRAIIIHSSEDVRTVLEAINNGALFSGSFSDTEGGCVVIVEER